MRLGVVDTPLGQIPAVELTLSERNLKTLLMGMEKGAEDNLVTRLTEFGVFTVRGESDKDHYAKRNAGRMDDATNLILDVCECEDVKAGEWCDDCAAHKPGEAETDGEA